MRISEEKYFEKYEQLVGKKIKQSIESFCFSEKNLDLKYQTQSSAVFSSNIEGNTLDLNSFMNCKLVAKKMKPQKEVQEIDDLISAYAFAQAHALTEKNFLYCHNVFSKEFLSKGNRGKYRTERVGVFGREGLVYMALEPENISEVMTEFFMDLKDLLKRDLTKSQIFYFASFIHLNFAFIHPFSDGNGRAARLIEKWFLAEKLGIDFWKISSEKYYKDHQSEYYENLNLGMNYYEVNFDRCMPFLLMLPESLR